MPGWKIGLKRWSFKGYKKALWNQFSDSEQSAVYCRKDWHVLWKKGIGTGSKDVVWISNDSVKSRKSYVSVSLGKEVPVFCCKVQ